jgi:NTE family protein
MAAVLDARLFGGRNLDAPRRNNLDIVIGACDMRTGTAFRFSNALVGNWRLGRAIDADNRVAFAVASSAAYPLFLPALDRTWTFELNDVRVERRVLLTDGGVYDSLGMSVLEPGRSARYGLHKYDCKKLVVCSAGRGQESGEDTPWWFIPRMDKAFSIVHRRVQDAAMHRLHELRTSGQLDAFALPYLGQQDDRLPIAPSDLVSREAVMNYPTDFAGMANEWIDRIATRGEQLTRPLVPHYFN